jgi:ATP-grasp domain-containing protein
MDLRAPPRRRLAAVGDPGVVRLNLGDAAQVRTVYAEILASAKAYLSALLLDGGRVGGSDPAGGNPSTPSPMMGEGRGGGEFAARPPNGQTRITGVSVQEMVGDGVEIIIGVNCDPQLGPVLLFGSGGVMVEVYNDVARRRCPITRSEAQAMIAEVKGARLLQGFRGRPAADLAALADTAGARVPPRHAPRRPPGRVGHQSADGAAVRSGSEGGRRPRRVSRHIALHVAESLPQKSPSSIIGRNGPLPNPTPAVEPRRREPLKLPLMRPRQRASTSLDLRGMATLAFATPGLPPSS